MAFKGGAILGIAGLAIGLIAAFATSSKASPRQATTPGEPGPTPEEISAAQEYQYMTGLTQTGMQSQNPDTMRQVANQLRNHKWVHPDVRNAAFNQADALDAAADNIEEAEKSRQDFEPYIYRTAGFGATRNRARLTARR